MSGFLIKFGATVTNEMLEEIHLFLNAAESSLSLPVIRPALFNPQMTAEFVLTGLAMVLKSD